MLDMFPNRYKFETVIDKGGYPECYLTDKLAVAFCVKRRDFFITSRRLTFFASQKGKKGLYYTIIRLKKIFIAEERIFEPITPQK